MFNDNQFESSEFYNKRYGTFFTKLIWPLVFMIILTGIFICFTKKEIVVKSTGVIEPEQPLSIIKSTSNNPVKINNLKEGKKVQNGTTLVQFDSQDTSNEQTTNDDKLHTNNSKIQALNTFKQSILTNKDLFYENDQYGFANEFHDYQTQISNINIESEQTNADIQASADTKNKKNADINRSNQNTSNKKQSLKNKELSSINQQISNLEENNIVLSGKAKSISTDASNQRILAPNTGILHVPNDQIKSRYLQNGSKIAEIYPNLNSKTNLIVAFYIPTNKLNGLKKNQSIRFKTNQDGPKPILIKGTVVKIDSAETQSKNGSVYKVIAQIFPTNKVKSNLHYGLNGNVSVITGKKTWFNYIKDKLFKSA